MTQTLKATLQEDLKTAMRNKDSQRREALRLIMAEIKQKEVDERIDVVDSDILVILDKMAKQRRDSIRQFQVAGRTDLVLVEQYELDLLQSYLPTPLTATEIDDLIKQVITTQQAASIKDMGKVMAILKPQMQGRADLAVVSSKVKEHLQ